MKHTKLVIAMAATLSATASFSALAMDLYVDSKTKQVFTEPGKGRVLLTDSANVKSGHTPFVPTPYVAPVAASDIDTIKKDLELKTNAIAALEEHAKEESDPKHAHVKLDDGIHFATKDGNFTAGINGRLQVDSQSNVNQALNNGGYLPGAGTMPSTLSDGMAIRRGRLGVEGTFFKNTFYKFEYDFTRAGAGNSTSSGVTDAFIGYNFTKEALIKVGAFKEPFSLEEATSNRYTTFIERNMAVNTFVDDLNTYKIGIGGNYSTDRWMAATSLQTEAVGVSKNTTSAVGGDTSNRNGGTGDTSWEVNGRVAGTPWNESKTKFLHVGAGGTYMQLNNNYKSDGSFSNGGITFANGIGNNVDRTNIMSTGGLTSGNKGAAGSHAVDHLTRFGAETAVVYGPFSAQTEYLRTDLSGQGYSGNALDGYYGYMTYFLTGESRNYKAKTASWDRIKPSRNFDLKGGWGAWELATGYDYLNLNSGPIFGGRASTAKVGINWYLNSHTRFMANYIKALDINNAGSSVALTKAYNNADFDIIETRVQLDW
ncbi:MAG: porin [Methylococcales bacterium]|nr:MAG: porin [Methylococcales bacterium]